MSSSKAVAEDSIQAQGIKPAAHIHGRSHALQLLVLPGAYFCLVMHNNAPGDVVATLSEHPWPPLRSKIAIGVRSDSGPWTKCQAIK